MKPNATKSAEHAVLTTEILEAYKEKWEYYKTHPWAWWVQCVRTRNEDAPPGQRENMPAPAHPHLKLLSQAWYREQYLQIDKSRQMTVTWFFCAMAIHEATHYESTTIGYQHMTLGDATDKLERYMLYVLTHIPLTESLPWVKRGAAPPDLWVRMVAAQFGLSLVGKPNAKQPAWWDSEAHHVAGRLCHTYETSSSSEGMEQITFYPIFGASSDSRSDIMAIPNGSLGPEKWRGYSFTRTLHDEYGFHPRLADNVNTAKAAVGQYGRQVLVTTATLGVDGDEYPLQMLEKDPVQPELPYAEIEGVNGRPGVEVWITKMGYTHMRIWYHADPNKRSEAYYKRAVLTGDLRKNRREVLIQYDQPQGEQFYVAFNERTQVVPSTPPSKDVPLILGFDGGRTPATVVIECLPSGHYVVKYEITSDGIGVQTHGRNVAEMMTQWYGSGWWRRHRAFGDPTLEFRHETSEESAARQLIDLGFALEESTNDLNVRYDAVTQLCQSILPFPGEGEAKPKLLIEQRCTQLIKAMSGLCEVDDVAKRQGVNKKKKNQYSHIVEALEYPCTRLGSVVKKSRRLTTYHDVRRSARGSR
jgi:hypothetical protein